MSQVENSLDGLGRIVTEIEAVARRADQRLVHDISKLRSAYVDEVTRLFVAMQGDLRLKQNPELAVAFEARFMEMRHRIGVLQAQWRMPDIAADPDGYASAIRNISDLSAPVRQWAKAELAKIAA